MKLHIDRQSHMADYRIPTQEKALKDDIYNCLYCIEEHFSRFCCNNLQAVFFWHIPLPSTSLSALPPAAMVMSLFGPFDFRLCRRHSKIDGAFVVCRSINANKSICNLLSFSPFLSLSLSFRVRSGLPDTNEQTQQTFPCACSLGRGSFGVECCSKSNLHLATLNGQQFIKN
jgi:hypothetical protein